MNGRDWFLVGSRLIGVWAAYTALAYFASYLDIRFGYSEEWGRTNQPGGYVLQGFAHLLFALYLLLGTRHLAWLCYERDEPLKGRGRPAPGSDLE